MVLIFTVLPLFVTYILIIYNNYTWQSDIPKFKNIPTQSDYLQKDTESYFFLIVLGQLRAVGIRPYYQGAGQIQ